MNKYIQLTFMLLMGLGITGCSSTQEKIVTEEILVNKVPLDLEMPKPVTWQNFEFVVVTPDNYQETVDKLKSGGKSIALFALDEDSYKNLSIVVNDMKRYMGEQKIIILEYKKYYEQEQKQ